MEIEILGAESLGVRGLSCLVKTANRRILIDPGLALGYHRQGLLPHPMQVAAGEDVRRAIIDRLANATDVVISHFHGDHMPLTDANPYQLAFPSVLSITMFCDVPQALRGWINCGPKHLEEYCARPIS